MGHGITLPTGEADLGEQSFNRMQHGAVVTEGFIWVVLSGESEFVELAEGTLTGPEHGSYREVD